MGRPISRDANVFSLYEREKNAPVLLEINDAVVDRVKISGLLIQLSRIEDLMNLW